MLFNFRKNERLCSQKLIGHLFAEGEKLFYFPFRFLYKVSNAKCNTPTQIVISVPKKLFKQAVKRNLIKRRIREAYRKYKLHFYQQLPLGCSVKIMLIYVSPKILSYVEIETRLIQAVNTLAKNIEKNTDISIFTAD